MEIINPHLELVKKSSVINELIKTNQPISIFYHTNPDPDCIGSAFGLFFLLKQLKKDVRIIGLNRSDLKFWGGNLNNIFINELKEYYNLINQLKNTSNESDFIKNSVAVMVDLNDIKRVFTHNLPKENFFNRDINNANKIITIDHHKVLNKNKDSFIYEFPSCCELIFLIQQYCLQNKMIDKILDISAASIYKGILGDTGFLTYQNILNKKVNKTNPNAIENPNTFETIQFLVNNTNLGNQKSKNNLTSMVENFNQIDHNSLYNEIMIKKFVYENTVGLEDKTIISFIVDEPDWTQNRNLISQTALNLGFQHVITAFYKPDGGVKFSVRKNDETTNGFDFAYGFEGGGHTNAFGFEIDVDKVKNILIKDKLLYQNDDINNNCLFIEDNNSNNLRISKGLTGFILNKYTNYIKEKQTNKIKVNDIVKEFFFKHHHPDLLDEKPIQTNNQYWSIKM